MSKKEKDRLFDNIPLRAAEFIKLVIKKMRYRKKVRADVMAELIAHFEDELHDCKSAEEKEKKAGQLIAQFGDVKLLAVLLRRAKKRCRPLWRTVVARGFQTVGVLILCLIVYLAWFFSGKPSIAIDYVAELNRIVRPVADETLNAAPLYNKAAELYDKAYDKSLELLSKKYDEVTVEQKQLIEKWLENNSEALELVIAGTQRPYYWQKYEGEEMLAVLMPKLAMFRRLAYSLRWRAWLQGEQGRYEAAFDDMKSCYRLGQHLKGDKTLIEQLVGIAIEALAIGTVRDIISEHKIDSARLAVLQQDIEQITANESFITSIKTERLFMYDEIQRCFTEDRLGDGHIYLPRVRKLMAMTVDISSEDESWFDAFCADVLYSLNFVGFIFIHPNKQETLKAADEFYDYFEQLAVKTAAQIHTESEAIDRKFEKLFSDNMLLNVLAPALRKVIEISNRLPADIDATLTIIAILRYRQALGDYPKNLQELVAAGYLGQVPMDTFSDKPLIYEKTEDNFILYSVGHNFTDDGGQVYRDDKGRIKVWGSEGDAVFWPVMK